MLLITGTMRVGSLMEFVSRVVLPLSVVAVALLRTCAAPLNVISIDWGIEAAFTSFR